MDFEMIRIMKGDVDPRVTLMLVDRIEELEDRIRVLITHLDEELEQKKIERAPKGSIKKRRVGTRGKE